MDDTPTKPERGYNAMLAKRISDQILVIKIHFQHSALQAAHHRRSMQPSAPIATLVSLLYQGLPFVAYASGRNVQFRQLLSGIRRSRQ